MASLAKLTLVGNLGRDAELKYTPKGTAVLEFSVAASERWTDGSGAQQEFTQWFRVSLWGRQAESLKTFLVKGKQVLVEGRLRAREYTDREGKHRTSLDVKADNILLLGSRGGADRDDSYGGGGGHPAELDRPDPGFNDEDIPF